MGSDPSDLYQVQSRDALQLSDTRQPRYLWVDLNIHNHENSTHAAIFHQNHIDIQQVDSLAKFNKEIEKYTHRLRVVCSASLPEQAYLRIQQSEKVDRAMLFCSNKIRAGSLLRSYSKIKVACFGSWEVARIIKLWSKEEEVSLLIFEEDSIEIINRHYSNILSLTDVKNICMVEAKQHFEIYVQKFLSNQRRQMDKIVLQFQKCRENKQLLIVFLSKYLVGSSLLAEAINQLLKATFNPKKLAYLRYIVSDTFHAIRHSYSSSQQLPIQRYYAVVEVNEAELKQLTHAKLKYTIFTYFLKASTDISSKALMSHELELIINVPQKIEGRLSNGYLQSGNGVVFNLGTYFKINHYSQANKSLTITLLQVGEQNFSLDREQHRVCINRFYQELQHKKYEGQECCLLWNRYDQAATDYISDKIKVLSKKQSEQDRIYKYRISLIARKLNNSSQTEDYQRLLEELEKSNAPRLAEYLSIGCEFYFRNKKTDKFDETFLKLGRLKDSITQQQLKNKYLLLKSAHEMIHAESEGQLAQKLRDLQQFQSSLADEVAYWNQFYHLLLRVKVDALIRLNQASKALQINHQLLQIISICEGRTSTEFIKLTQLKDSILQSKNRQSASQEMAKKARIFRSNISLNSLKKQRYFTDIEGIDLNFYS